MRSYQDYLKRGRYQWGDKFTEPDAPQFIPFYESGERIEVTTVYPSGDSFVRRGTVGATTGWSPCFLLIHRKNDIGSWDTLSISDKITALIDRRGRRIPC